MVSTFQVAMRSRFRRSGRSGFLVFFIGVTLRRAVQIRVLHFRPIVLSASSKQQQWRLSDARCRKFNFLLHSSSTRSGGSSSSSAIIIIITSGQRKTTSSPHTFLSILFARFRQYAPPSSTSQNLQSASPPYRSNRTDSVHC